MTFDTLNAILDNIGIVDIGVLLVNICLIIFAGPILAKLSAGDTERKTLSLRVLALRGIALLGLATYSYMEIFQHGEYDSVSIKILSILAILYFSYLGVVFAQFFIFRAYGKIKSVGGKSHYAETYQSRALSLLATVFIIVLSILACIRILGFDSLLEAGGVIGIIGVMIGLTQGSWAPDIIGGLILLNSDIIDEGNVIELDNGIIGLIFKTKMFHTEILNLSNNHRIMIRNAKLREYPLHNLSKFASAKGLRECLTFNIGYDVPIEKVNRCFQLAKQHAIKRGVLFEHQHEIEVKVLETADHAIKWGFIYYVKAVESLIAIRREMREAVLVASVESGISLATPLTHKASINQESAEPSMAPMPAQEHQGRAPS